MLAECTAFVASGPNHKPKAQIIAQYCIPILLASKKIGRGRNWTGVYFVCVYCFLCAKFNSTRCGYLYRL